MRDTHRFLEELNEDLRSHLKGKEKTLQRLIYKQRDMDTVYLYANILSFLKYLYNKHSPMFVDLIKNNIVAVLFTIQWIDPHYIMDSDRVYYNLLQTLYSDGKVNKNVYTRSITFYKEHVKPKKFTEIIRRDSMLYNPIARLVLDSLISFYKDGMEEGSRIAVIGSVGSGKTTLMFYTLYTILVGIGIDEKEAMKYTGSLITNKYEKLKEYVQIVSEKRYRLPIEKRLYIPLLAVDDVSTLVSKYWLQIADKREREIALKLIKMLKITREGIGVVALLSDTTESIAKGMKEGIDNILQGEKNRKEGDTYTFWGLKKPSVKIIGGKPYNPLSVVDVIIETSYAYMGTIHKYMSIPTQIYVELEEEKVERRRQILAKETTTKKE